MITNEQIKWIMKKAGLSPRRLSARLGVEVSQITKWTTGVELPASNIESKLRKIEADFGGVTGALAPTKIREIGVRNRIVFPAMLTRYADANGLPSMQSLNHYMSIANGGVGMVTLEPTSVSQSRFVSGSMGIWDDAQVEALSKLIEVVHKA
ncbi:MAG: hypothetical protein ABIH42_04750, partial [Planctomycetota bacterium]